MYCKGDPCIPEFYQRHQAVAEVTAKLGFHGEEKKGLLTKAIATVDKKLAEVKVDNLASKENQEGTSAGNIKKKRHSADRDMASMGLILSPRKRRCIE